MSVAQYSWFLRSFHLHHRFSWAWHFYFLCDISCRILKIRILKCSMLGPWDRRASRETCKKEVEIGPGPNEAFFEWENSKYMYVPVFFNFYHTNPIKNRYQSKWSPYNFFSKEKKSDNFHLFILKMSAVLKKDLKTSWQIE